MNNPEQSSEIGKREDFRMKTSKQIEGYLHEGLPIFEMAQILNARDFVTREVKKGKEFTHFKVKEYVDDLISKGMNLRLPDQIIQSSKVILPPDQGEIQRAITGENKFEKPKYIPRTQFLMELLSDMQIPYSVVSGKNDPNMVRELSYQPFILPENSRIVMVNNEEDNATYIIKDIENPIENWEDYSGMTKQQLQELEGRVDKIVYPGDEVKWKDDMRIALLKEVEIKKKSKDAQEINAPILSERPLGWPSARGASRQLHVRRAKFISLSEKYLKANPELSGEFGNREYYSPDLISIMKKEVLPFAESGWRSKRKTAKRLGVDISTIERRMDKMENKSSTKVFRPLRGRAAEHIGPELFNELDSAINSRDASSMKGETVDDLSRRLGVSRSFIDRAVKKYTTSRPDWVKRSENVASAKRLDAELIDIIESKAFEYLKYPEIPDKWISVEALAKKLGINRKTLKRMLEEYMEDHGSEWFGKFRVKSNIAECVGPELAKNIENTIESIGEPEGGWKTAHECYLELKKTDDSISLYAFYEAVGKYEANNPDSNSFGLRRRKGMQIYMFYSPQAIEEILNTIRTKRKKIVTP